MSSPIIVNKGSRRRSSGKAHCEFYSKLAIDTYTERTKKQPTFDREDPVMIQIIFELGSKASEGKGSCLVVDYYDTKYKKYMYIYTNSEGEDSVEYHMGEYNNDLRIEEERMLNVKCDDYYKMLDAVYSIANDANLRNDVKVTQIKEVLLHLF